MAVSPVPSHPVPSPPRSNPTNTKTHHPSIPRTHKNPHTLYGMNFFVFDSDNSRFRATSDIWVFVATWIPLTALTVGIYAFYVWRRKKALQLRRSPRRPGSRHGLRDLESGLELGRYGSGNCKVELRVKG